METSISIVVSCYNLAGFLGETLESVARQSWQDWECIIVNDGSTDATGRLAKGWTNRDKRFKYHYQENKGLPDARNAGIQRALGTYILPLDADDLLDKSFLAKAHAIISRNSHIKIVYSNTELFGAESGLWNEPFSMKELLRRNLIPASAMFRKSDWRSCGGYSTTMKGGFEDWDFWLSLLEKGGEVHKIEEALFKYRRRADSMAAGIDSQRNTQLRKQIVMNHLPLYLNALGDPLTLTLEMEDAKRRLALIQNSRSYKLGQGIARLFRMFTK